MQYYKKYTLYINIKCNEIKFVYLIDSGKMKLKRAIYEKHN